MRGREIRRMWGKRTMKGWDRENLKRMEARNNLIEGERVRDST